MTQRKFEVSGEDENGDLWVVATDLRETAESMAEKFRDDGYQNVRIVEN